MTKLRPNQSWFKRFWKKHTRKLVVGILVTYFLIFILYDAYSGMVDDGLKGHNNLEKGEEDKRSNFEID